MAIRIREDYIKECVDGPLWFSVGIVSGKVIIICGTKRELESDHTSGKLIEKHLRSDAFPQIFDPRCIKPESVVKLTIDGTVMPRATGMIRTAEFFISQIFPVTTSEIPQIMGAANSSWGGREVNSSVVHSNITLFTDDKASTMNDIIRVVFTPLALAKIAPAVPGWYFSTTDYDKRSNLTDYLKRMGKFKYIFGKDEDCLIRIHRARHDTFDLARNQTIKNNKDRIPFSYNIMSAVPGALAKDDPEDREMALECNDPGRLYVQNGTKRGAVSVQQLEGYSSQQIPGGHQDTADRVMYVVASDGTSMGTDAHVRYGRAFANTIDEPFYISHKPYGQSQWGTHVMDVMAQYQAVTGGELVWAGVVSTALAEFVGDDVLARLEAYDDSSASAVELSIAEDCVIPVIQAAWVSTSSGTWKPSNYINLSTQVPGEASTYDNNITKVTSLRKFMDMMNGDSSKAGASATIVTALQLTLNAVDDDTVYGAYSLDYNAIWAYKQHADSKAAFEGDGAKFQVHRWSKMAEPDDSWTHDWRMTMHSKYGLSLEGWSSADYALDDNEPDAIYEYPIASVHLPFGAAKGYGTDAIWLTPYTRVAAPDLRAIRKTNIPNAFMMCLFGDTYARMPIRNRNVDRHDVDMLHVKEFEFSVGHTADDGITLSHWYAGFTA